MKPFNWEIGKVPEGWEKANIVRVFNGDFRHGPCAAVEPVFYEFPIGVDPNVLRTYRFYYEQRHKVRAWVDWFMKEYDER